MVIYDETENGVTTEVRATNEWVALRTSSRHGADYLTMTRDEAIAAARAILAHYKEPV